MNKIKTKIKENTSKNIKETDRKKNELFIFKVYPICSYTRI